MDETKANVSFYIIIIFLPFFLFHWMLPFISDVTIGSDYLRFAFWPQFEFQFALKTGTFPLYIPGFASGHSSSAMTLGQICHPISYMASLMPGYWDGSAIEWTTFLKLLSLGFTQIILFIFLRELKFNNVISFLLSFITVYNLRMIELFRDGAPLEAYTGHIILYSIIGWSFIRPSKFLGPLSIILFTYYLVTSGHPEEMYYGMIGGGIFTLVAPFLLSEILDEKIVDRKIVLAFWAKIFSCLMLGILLSSVYIFPFYFEFVQMDSNRVVQSYALANDNLDTLIGTFNNFLLPLRSHVFVAFGGSSLIIAAVILPVLRLFKVKIPASVLFVWLFVMFIFLHMQGSRTPIHRLMWEYFPFASSIRVAGRITIIMPFFSMILLAWIFKSERQIKYISLLKSLKPLNLIALLSVFILSAYYCTFLVGYYFLKSSLFIDLFPPYFSENFRQIPFAIVELLFVMSGIALLTGLVFYHPGKNYSKIIGTLLILISILQIGLTLRYRAVNWIEPKYRSPSFENMVSQKKDSLDFRSYAGYGMNSIAVKKQLQNSFMEPFLGKIFTHVIPVKTQNEAYENMRLNRSPQQIFIEKYDAVRAKEITERSKHVKQGEVTLTYSSFNRLQFDVKSETRALFGLSYPYTGNWNVWLNGEKIPVYRVNGASHAVEIPAGESIVEFRYWSQSYLWGVVTSCITFLAVGLFICISRFTGKVRILAALSVVVISIGIFMSWYYSLYGGDNLKTDYRWNYSPPGKEINHAYGKKIWLDTHSISSSLAARGLALYGSRLVDGNRSSCSGYSSKLTDGPAWLLDLNKAIEIKSIVLYENCKKSTNEGPLNMLDAFTRYSVQEYRDELVNLRPIHISLSDDGASWTRVISKSSQAKNDKPFRIDFDELYRARFIKIEASGKSRFALDEVEVYGPEVY